ncbi:hypothetical protein WJX84_007862 [Apatococcus fuscideae]|uniref:3-dehydroquinate synthase n=1 Tax=Apatococcus fuscideae TaxID=2026836 RepID=A0AAW1TFL0_9CHLO
MFCSCYSLKGEPRRPSLRTHGAVDLRLGVAKGRTQGISLSKAQRFSLSSNSRSTFPICLSTQPHAEKLLWIETSEQGVFTSAIESGLQNFLFRPQYAKLAEDWRKVAQLKALFVKDNAIVDSETKQVASVLKVASADDLKTAQLRQDHQGLVILAATDWRMIPAENLVAAFQESGAQLMAESDSAEDGKAMLEALEAGVAGIVLRTNDPSQVRKLAAYVKQRNAAAAPRLPFSIGTVVRVQPAGMADRVCVDTCSILQPGEGLMVGSFARALFLVHSECAESQYIASRPFRINAGPVHAYISGSIGKTAYLSELVSGSEVTVVDPSGHTRQALVGRCKIEKRPMVLVEAQTEDGLRHSLLLQNAETGPVGGLPEQAPPGSRAREFEALPVTELKIGDRVFVWQQAGARHTGISIQESILER